MPWQPNSHPLLVASSSHNDVNSFALVLCSYLAPIVADLAAQQPPITRVQGTFAIVICPTRELCLQVADVLTMLVRRFVWLVRSYGELHVAAAQL